MNGKPSINSICCFSGFFGKFSYCKSGNSGHIFLIGKKKKKLSISLKLLDRILF